jgi:serine/threonine-protein kinase
VAAKAATPPPGALPAAAAKAPARAAAEEAPAAAPAGGGVIDLPAAVGPPPGVSSDPTAVKKPRLKTLEKLVGRTLNGRYRVIRKLGEGGFGAVFEGLQTATGRSVALKVLHPHNVQDATVVARFRREAEACSKLRNEHTVTIYDFDETEDGVLYLAMELLRGRSLQQIERDDGTLDPLRVLRILDQVADALGEAHALGIVHRDMKPENVMIEPRDGEDFVKVLDFGIAKIVSADASKGQPALTAVGQTLGTLEFMSPEQLRGKDLDGRSDIYALGMMAYEMLTGELPFKEAKSSTDVIQFHLQTPAPPPSSLRPELKLPPEVDQIVLKMVAKSRDERHEDTAALRQHIQEVLAASEKSAVRREAVRVIAVVGGILVVLATLLVLASR